MPGGEREEQQARAGLETLVNTSPVGVAVLDAARSAGVGRPAAAGCAQDEGPLAQPPRTVVHGDYRLSMLEVFVFWIITGGYCDYEGERASVYLRNTLERIDAAIADLVSTETVGHE